MNSSERPASGAHQPAEGGGTPERTIGRAIGGDSMETTNQRFLGVAPQFRVTELVETAEYYRDVLGFQLEEYFGDPPKFTQARRDSVVIQLGSVADASRATRGHEGIGYNAYIWVQDVGALARELSGRGAEILEGPVDRSYGCRELVVRDCNQIVLCFAQDTLGN